MRLSNVLDITGDTLIQGSAETEVTGLCSDSRRLESGAVFAALEGAHYDGHDHIEAALENGAIAILSNRRTLSLPANIAHIYSADPRTSFARYCARFWSARPDMVVAVTGTNGKTSTTDYLRQIWTRVTWPAAAMGTLGITSSVDALNTMSANLTTPLAEDFFASVHRMKRHGITHLAFESSSHGLAQSRLAGLGVNVAVFTNLSQDHLDWHHTMEAYFEAKARLFEDNLLEGGTAVINIDDEWGRRLAHRLEGKPVVVWGVGQSPDADFHISQINRQPFGLDISVTARGEEFSMPVALSGDFQAMNIVMAAAAAHASGMPLHDCFAALTMLLPVRGRMQPVHGHPKGARIIIDYAHTPDALEKALIALQPETSGALRVVFGCGGDRDQAKRAQMGEIAARIADDVIITDDNPRSENPAAIRADILTACPEAQEIALRDNAIKTAIQKLNEGDSLLIAGKGHEMVQMIGTETLPFDDAAVARSALSQMQGEVS